MTKSTPKFSTFVSRAIQVVAIALVIVGFGASSTFAQPRAYVANRFDHTVSVIDSATNTVVATVPVGGTPAAVAGTPDGAFAYVANASDGTVSVIDTATNTVIATVSVAGALAVAIRPDGAFAYVTNVFGNSVSVIDTATNTVITSILVGAGPFAITFPTRGPADPIGSLIAQVQALVAGHSLTSNQGARLIDKLEHVQTKIDNGQTTAACNQLTAFINQVNAFINSRSLTESQGQALIDAARAIKTGMGC